MKKIAIILCNDMHMDIEKANRLLNNLKQYEITINYREADVIIIYLCALGKTNKVKSMQILADIVVNAKPSVRIIVTGCMVKTDYNLLQEFTGEVIGFDELLETIGGSTSSKDYPIIKSNQVVISEGCKYNCSYCFYTQICPKYVSKPFHLIYEEVKEMDKSESTIYLTGGQETSNYGIDLQEKTSIEELVEKLAIDFPNTNFVIGWFHPAGLTDSMIEVLSKHKNIIEIGVHIQHVDEKILKSMGRPCFSRTDMQIKKLLNARPDIRISTEVIVGYPGESEEQFWKLVEYLDRGYFYDIGVAMFESVHGTKAATLSNKVPYAVKKRRMQIISKIIREKYKSECYFTDDVDNIDLLEIFYQYLSYFQKLPSELLRNTQVYECIAGVDTLAKIQFQNHLEIVLELIINARTDFNFKRSRERIEKEYSKEARIFFRSIFEASDLKPAIKSRATQLLN